MKSLRWLQKTQNADGSWVYKSTDRYANTSDGRRILLREDGSWEYIGNQKAVSPVQYRSNDIDIGLTRVEIEEYKKPATGNKKSPRLSTETNFYFTATVTSTGEPIFPNVRNSKGKISGFVVSDDYGKEYKVLELSPVDAVELKPGESINYRLKGINKKNIISSLAEYRTGQCAAYIARSKMYI